MAAESNYAQLSTRKLIHMFQYILV